MTKITLTVPAGAKRAVYEIVGSGGDAAGHTYTGRVIVTFYDADGKEIQHVDVSGDDAESAPGSAEDDRKA